MCLCALCFWWLDILLHLILVIYQCCSFKHQRSEFPSWNLQLPSLKHSQCTAPEFNKKMYLTTSGLQHHIHYTFHFIKFFFIALLHLDAYRIFPFTPLKQILSFSCLGSSPTLPQNLEDVCDSSWKLCTFFVILIAHLTSMPSLSPLWWKRCCERMRKWRMSVDLQLKEMEDVCWCCPRGFFTSD